MPGGSSSADGSRASLLPHPLTGHLFGSPVTPGTGWPQDPASADTPVAARAGDVARLAATATDQADLQARVSVCRACPRLVTWREQVATTGRRAFAGEPYWGRPVPGWGDPLAWLLIVGLAPAAHGGNRTGRVFTGDRSGDWIFAALHRAGLARLSTSVASGDGQELRGVRIAAAVRCAPPQNKPLPGERDACAPWLDQEVRFVRDSLRCILALGRFAWDAALACAARLGWADPRPRPVFGHGASVRLGPVVLVGSYHVSQQNTFTGRLTLTMIDDVLRLCVDSGQGHPANS